MEPTIYKPSIYKGAGVYKTGAGGGGDEKKVFLVPFCDNVRTTAQLESTIYIDNNVLKKTQNDSHGLFLGTLPFDTASEFELKFKFKYSADTSIYSQIIGGQYYFWRDPTIWRAKLESGLSYIAFGIPDGSDTWHNVVTVATEISENDIVEIIARCNNVSKKIELNLYKNDVFIGKDEFVCSTIDYSRMSNMIMLDAGNTNNNTHYFLGEIYLDDSYIKIDGQRYF